MGSSPPTGELVPEGMKLAAVANERWDSATDEDLRTALASITPGVIVHPNGPTDIAALHERRGTTYYDLQWTPPVTFAFQTRKGELGILQVIRYTEEPRGMRIRYKLVQTPAAAGGAVAKGGMGGMAAGFGREWAVNLTPEMKALQGWWNVVRIEKGKQAKPLWTAQWSERIGNDIETIGRLMIRGDSLVFWQIEKPGGPVTPPGVGFHYTLDAKASPKTIDLRGSGNALGIYEVAGDRLKLCLAQFAPALKTGQRPTSFVVEPDSGSILLTLERYEPAKKAEASRGQEQPAAPKGHGSPSPEQQPKLGEKLGIRPTEPPRSSVNAAAELKVLLGKWKVVQCTTPKGASPSWPVHAQSNINPAKVDRISFRQDYVELSSSQDGSSVTVDYHIDPTAMPKNFDLGGIETGLEHGKTLDSDWRL